MKEENIQLISLEKKYFEKKKFLYDGNKMKN